MKQLNIFLKDIGSKKKFEVKDTLKVNIKRFFVNDKLKKFVFNREKVIYAGEYLGKAKKDFENVIFMNFEQTKNKDIAKLLKVDYWTTIVVYKDNKELAREIGLYKQEDIYNLIKKGI